MNQYVAIDAYTVNGAEIETKNLIITGDNLNEGEQAFYAGIMTGKESLPDNAKLNIDAKDIIKIDSVAYGIYNSGDGRYSADNIYIKANAIIDDKYWAGPRYIGGEAVHTKGILNLTANNLVITGNNLKENEKAFYAGIRTGNEGVPEKSELFIKINKNMNIDSVVYGIYNNGVGNYSADTIYIKANAIINNEHWTGEPQYIGGEAVNTKGILNLTANNNMTLIGELVGLNIFGGSVKSTSESEFQDNIGTTYVKAVNGKLNIIGELENGVYSQMQPYQDGIKTAELKAGSTVNIYGKENGGYVGKRKSGML